MATKKKIDIEDAIDAAVEKAGLSRSSVLNVEYGEAIRIQIREDDEIKWIEL